MDSVARLASGVHTRPMDIIANIWNWLAAAPVFIQVALGLLLFFVVLCSPIIALAVYNTYLSAKYREEDLRRLYGRLVSDRRDSGPRGGRLSTRDGH